MDTIIPLLKDMGITVNRLEKDQRFYGESFHIEKWNQSPRKFEGHFMASVEGNFVRRDFLAKRGDYIVDMMQPLANLIFYLLEPQSDDGLLTWNFFDKKLASAINTSKSFDYPVFKYFNY
jgi:hypothetical protein